MNERPDALVGPQKLALRILRLCYFENVVIPLMAVAGLVPTQRIVNW
jgi:hypothetical protein